VPTYLTPGVYVEEVVFLERSSRAYTPPISSQAPLAPVTRWKAEHSIAAFVGQTPYGPVGPSYLTNWSTFEHTFLGWDTDEPRGPLALAVSGFFANGGESCFVIRVDGPDESSSLRPDRLDDALQVLASVTDVSTVCAPDVMAAYGSGVIEPHEATDMQVRLIAHCENMGERICILDSPPSSSPQGVLEWRQNVAGFDSKFAAVYYPWLEVVDDTTRRRTTVPPCGHVAGIYARTDLARGFHRTPANEPVIGALGVERHLTWNERSGLNPAGINLLVHSRRGILVWGGRTLSSDRLHSEIRTRRLANFIARSVRDGTEWVIAQRPDDRDLWARILGELDAFLSLLWRSGVLAGETPSEAYVLRCDDETNPPEVTEAGQIVVECTIAPTTAALLAFRVVYFCG